ncbi:MAG: hypothetical protein ACOZNI_13015 [Myxococcota bacterium]
MNTPAEVADATANPPAAPRAILPAEEPVGDAVPVKLPADLVARADALIEPMQRDPEMVALLGRAGRVTRAAIIKYALLRAGLPDLERRYLRKS